LLKAFLTDDDHWEKRKLRRVQVQAEAPSAKHVLYPVMTGSLIPTNQVASGLETRIIVMDYLPFHHRQHTIAGQQLLAMRDALSSTEQAYIDDEIAINDRRILALAQTAYNGRKIPVATPAPIPKKQ
jgi:hypothetical protein